MHRLHFLNARGDSDIEAWPIGCIVLSYEQFRGVLTVLSLCRNGGKRFCEVQSKAYNRITISGPSNWIGWTQLMAKSNLVADNVRAKATQPLSTTFEELEQLQRKNRFKIKKIWIRWESRLISMDPILAFKACWHCQRDGFLYRPVRVWS